MANKSKAIRAQSVKVEMDGERRATALGGAALLERVLRGLGLLKILRRELAPRGEAALYAMAESCHALVAALVLGGRGIGAAEALREDEEAARLFGMEQGVPEEATMHRCLTEAAGLAPRERASAYEAAGRSQPRMDFLGRIKRAPKLRMKKAEAPEGAGQEARERLRGMLASAAQSCFKALRTPAVRLAGFAPVFGDATDLEVEGERFDAARVGRDGRKHLRWFTLMLGPILFEQELTPGNTDEGRHIPEMILRAKKPLREMLGKGARLLALLDSAYFERPVIEALGALKARFIVGANQFRASLERLAQAQPAWAWAKTGGDAARGWAESEVCALTHRPEGWAKDVTIIARRWRQTGELPGSPWHYAFVGTDLEKSDLPEELVKEHGYAQLIWMLYGTKQGRETHYRQALEDLGLHHPPSSRLGINQAFYALGAVATNVAMVLRYRVLGGGAAIPMMKGDEEAAAKLRRSKAPQKDRGMSLRRLREKYFQVAATLAQSARTLTVRLLAGARSAEWRIAWLAAWAEAGEL
jgi:hypothetical protein